MSRWNRGGAAGYGARQQQKVARSCCSCRAVETKGSPLKVYRTDGSLYCMPCWESWYEQPQAHSTKLTVKPSRQSDSDELLRVDEACSQGHCVVSSAPEVDSNSGSSAVAYTSAEAALNGDLHKSPLFAASSSSTEVPDTFSATAVDSHFSRQVSQLRVRYSTERNTDAEEQQLEEIETLEAIYGETLQRLNTEPGQPHILQLELPTEMTSQDGTEIFIDDPNGEIAVGVVQALPPLILRCALPARYPEDEMPIFSLEAKQLSSAAHQELREELERLAIESPGQPLLFMWASALQERPSPPQRLLLEVVDSDGGLARNMDRALELLAYDHRIRDERRQREMHRCPMCFEDVLGSRGLFLTCDHFGCRECLGQMAQIHTGEADLSSLRCPYQGCGEPFGIEAVTELLGADSPVLARWEELSLQRCLDRMGDVAFCPRCDANGVRVPCIQDEDHMAKCEACLFVFCGKCKSVFHPGTPCADRNDQMWALEQRARGQGREAEAAQGELLTLRLLSSTTRNCPKCSTAIQKSEGCNKMHCKNCGVYFCWKCSKEITGYDHFASSECRLFDAEEIRRWNQQMQQTTKAQARAHERQFLAQFVDHAGLGDQGRDCPRCKNVVAREGRNNHLRCFACQTPFCAACGVVLPNKNPGQHFNGKGTCPQHSD